VLQRPPLQFLHIFQIGIWTGGHPTKPYRASGRNFNSAQKGIDSLHLHCGTFGDGEKDMMLVAIGLSHTAFPPSSNYLFVWDACCIAQWSMGCGGEKCWPALQILTSPSRSKLQPASHKIPLWAHHWPQHFCCVACCLLNG